MAQVLGDGCRCEPEPGSERNALQVSEQHLDAFALTARLLEGLSLGERSRYISGLLKMLRKILRNGSFGRDGPYCICSQPFLAPDRRSQRSEILAPN